MPEAALFTPFDAAVGFVGVFIPPHHSAKPEKGLARKSTPQAQHLIKRKERTLVAPLWIGTVDRPMAVAEMEARSRASELSRLRAWEQLQRLRTVLEALCGRRLPEPEHRGFEAEGDAVVGALYEA